MFIVQDFEKILLSRDGKDKDYLFSYAKQVFPLSLNLKNSDKLVVFFPGAFDLKLDMPKFQRKSYFLELPYNTVSFFDPTLMMHHNVAIGWFQGDKNTDLFSLLYPVLKSLIDSLNIKHENVIFFASSAGGIPALKLGTKFKGINVYLGNVQTNALKYYEKPVNTMLNSCYAGVKSLELYEHKLNILNEYGDINVYYAQNIADNLHYKEHYLPFMDASQNSFRKLESIVYEHKDSGHNPISKKVEYDVIESIFNNASIKHIYDQLLENKN
ncbi:hypothetical protein [Acinetobacter sp. MN12]|uniref:hypothetical protein n=1 Tax=Acinetobacter sp. MN12 TaxID=1513354 RepID=UPI00051CAA9C|nr:hypothetical protein [Acinetobacter sp. MN12]